MEREHGDRKRAVAAEIALLFEMARNPWRASEHFLAAAQVASDRFAAREAMAFAKKGLSCLGGVRDQPEIEARELALQKALLHPLGLLEGYGAASTERVSQRIIELSERLGDHGSLFAALDGAAIVHMVRGECPEAAAIADRMIAVADQSGSIVQQMNALMWATIGRHHLGQLHLAQAHADACIRLETQCPASARVITIFDPVVATLAESSRNLWMLGDTRGCLERAERAVALARTIGHPESLSFALVFHGWMRGYREEWDAALGTAAEGLSLSGAQGLVQTRTWHGCIHGWALAHTGRPADGLAEVQSAIQDSTRILGQIAMPQLHAMLAEVLIIRGEHARALDEVQRFLCADPPVSDAHFVAELHRLAAVCHLALGETDAAEASLHAALATARSQGAVTFELRASTALGQLWARRTETHRARMLLQGVLDGLDDPEDTVDVRRARACLAEWTRS
jgi:hypothetical protein